MATPTVDHNALLSWSCVSMGHFALFCPIIYTRKKITVKDTTDRTSTRIRSKTCLILPARLQQGQSFWQRHVSCTGTLHAGMCSLTQGSLQNSPTLDWHETSGNRRL